MEQGKVWLVGAGPGDMGLFTLRGKQVLEQAEVVVYDRLIGNVLSLMPPDAEWIDVGKAAGYHKRTQQEICEILLEQAKQNKRVVRLKGGDPFLFGRGGEELDFLQKHGVSVEVVPGVTSSLAVPCYGGIPVTHREVSSSLHIFTGHQKEGGLPLDFPTIAKLSGTLVFLMGVSSLSTICTELVQNGMPSDTPAAILENGTLARQRRVVGTLATLPVLAAQAQIGTPAIIVVGVVCALASELDWAANRPLHGASVLVTRMREKSGTLAVRLQDLGAEVRLLPAIETVEIPVDGTAFREALFAHDWLVFSSPSAVTFFFQNLQSAKTDLRQLSRQKIAAVGKATATALAERGLLVDLMPETAYGKKLAEAVAKALQPGQRALVFCPENQQSDTVDTLQSLTTQVTPFPLYRTEYPAFMGRAESGDLAVFTSASCVKGFCNSIGTIPAGITAVCIGEKTAEAAREVFFDVQVSDVPSIDSLLEKVITIHQERNERQ